MKVKLFEKRKIKKEIYSLEKELINIRKILYHIYDGIEILLNNMGKINKKRFDSQVNYIENNLQMNLFQNWNERLYFKQVLKGIGLSEISIKAYLHGFLNTFKFEYQESNLVDKLNDYNRKLKLLIDEPFKYKCVKCNEEIINKYKEMGIKCSLCSSKMYILLSYNKCYNRDFNSKLSNKAKYSLLDIMNVKK